MKNIILFVCLCGFLACSTGTKIENSWKEPSSVFEKGANQKMLIVGMVKDENSRKIVEDNLVKKLNVSAVQSYTLIDEKTIKAAKIEDINDQVKKGGFTHILMVRLADVQENTTYNPETTTGFYGAYGRFLGNGAGIYGEPGQYTTDKNYIFETVVYTIEPDKLIYKATTNTANPANMDKNINAVANTVLKQMKKDGFIVKSSK